MYIKHFVSPFTAQFEGERRKIKSIRSVPRDRTIHLLKNQRYFETNNLENKQVVKTVLLNEKRNII